MNHLAPTLLIIPLLVACAPQEVDETGYLRAPQIDTTSEFQLDKDEPKRLLVVGNPGAVEIPDGLLTISAASGSVATFTVDDPAGSFVVSLDSVEGDTLELHYERDGSDSLTLDLEGTAVLSAPDCSSCLAALFSPPDAQGNTSVDTALLENPTPPYTLLNLTSGVAARGGSTETVLRIPASTGDTACLYSVDESLGQSSASTCEEVP